MACDNLLNYSDFNETFKIHTDDRAFQLVAVISQKGKPIAFCSMKLTDAQLWYKVTERELLSILETLKEFKAILFGQKLRIYTDHKKLTCTILNTNRVLIWILRLEEYGPDIKYTKGKNNIVIDGL